MILASTSGGLLLHILRNPLAIGMANTDTEGTLWWIWSKCEGRIKGDVATEIGAPYGFDTSRFATFNIVDESRVLFSRLMDCDQNATLLVVSLLPLVALTLNLIAIYALGWTVSSSRSISVAIALCGGVSSQLLLATRTPLANNLLAPGILALLFYVRSTRTSRLTNIVAVCVMISIQMLSNAYNGMAFVIVLCVFVVTFSATSDRGLLSALSELLALAVSATAGLFPLLRTQLFLLHDQVTRSIYRPVDIAGEVISPLVLISRSHSWFTNLLPDNFPRPESGWISAPLLIAWLISCRYVFREGLITERSRLAAASSFSAVLITIIAFEVPGTGFIRSVYFDLFSPFRGVNNYAKLVPLLLALSVGVMMNDSFKKCFRAPRDGKRATALCLAMTAVITLNVVDSIPTSPTFRERTPLTPVRNFYAQFERQDTGIAAHYPAVMYGREWGLPLRFIQLAQMYTGDTLANGRTFDQLQEPCTHLPNPSNAYALGFLESRGVSRIVLHRQLMDPGSFEDSIEFLGREGFRSASYSSSDTTIKEDLGKALDVVLFDLPQRDDRAVCGSIHR